MTCSDCKYLKDNDKKCGALCGAKYYCSKVEKYVDGSCNCCEAFDKSYGRSAYECDRIYEEGYKFSDDDKPVSFYVTMLIVILTVGTFLTLVDKFMII